MASLSNGPPCFTYVKRSICSLLCLRRWRREPGGGRQRWQVCALPVHASLPQTEDGGSYVSKALTSTSVDDGSFYFASSPLWVPTGWNSQLETDPWTISGWSSATTSAITCWRASTLTLASASPTVGTPASTFMSSPSCRRAWVSRFSQVTLPVCLHCFGAENVIILLIIIIRNDSGIPL